jgi:DNA (cytosine-5)-methyltransferase 1
MDPKDLRSQEVYRFFEVVAKLKPKGFVMENVPSLAIGTRFREIRESLIKKAQGLGFKTQLMILNSAHYGVAQSRKRMFLVGLRGIAPSIPSPSTYNNPYTVRETVAGLGNLDEQDHCQAQIVLAKNPILRSSPYAGMMVNGAGRPLNLEAPALTLPASMGGNRTPIIDQQALEHPEQENWFVSYHKHLSKKGKVALNVPAHLRRLTVQEAQALQSFPKEWKFVGPIGAKFRQIGNAVPCQLAYHLALSIKADLEVLESS